MKRSILSLALLAVLLMTGCKPTEYITVPEYHERLVHSHDTVHQRDSFISNTTTTIREVDSAALAKLGIQISGMKSAYLVEIDRLRQEMSSLQRSRSDTVLVRDSVPVVKVVPAQLTAWQRAKVKFGEIVLAILAVFAAVVAFSFYRQRKN